MSKEKANKVEDNVGSDGVFDLDKMIKRSRENVVKVRLGGVEYTLKKMTRKVLAKFNQLGAELRRVEELTQKNPDLIVEDKMSPHELVSKQLNTVLDTPIDAFDEVDIIDLKNILEFVMEKIGLSGESLKKDSKQSEPSSS